MRDDLVKRLPVIIAFSMGILVGTLCYVNGLKSSDICFRTAISIAMFYLAGVMVRRTIINLGVRSMTCVAEKPEKGGNIDVIVGDDEVQ